MRLTRTLALAALAPLAAAPLTAQDLCEGNGLGAAYMKTGPAYLGGYYVLDFGSPNVPLSLAILSVSDGLAIDTHPLVGPVCLDLHTPAYHIYAFPTDATGNVHVPLYLPPVPALVGFPPFYSNAATFEGGAWSLSKTVPLWFENPNSWSFTGAMAQGRILHRMTFLGADGADGNIKVLVSGGGGGTVTIPTATATTEVFDPNTRQYAPGPAMSVERSAHTATRLLDGRVLLAGGLDSTRTCHASAEVFDPQTGAITPVASMSTPRSAHTATLLDDGRVLVTGGFADYRYPEVLTWDAALNTAQDTAEIFDPQTGTWTPVATSMSSKRAGHTATKLADGRVLIVGGVYGGGIGSVFGGVVPFHTNTCDLFDPATDTFAPAAPMTFGRAFHGASLLGDGHVLVCGGTYTGGTYGEAISTTSCVVWDGAVWSSTAPLTAPAAWLTQLAMPDGRAFVCGGLNSTGLSLTAGAFAGFHDGTAFTPAESIGINPSFPAQPLDPRGAQAAVVMHDGAVLLGGGTLGDAASILGSSYVFTPGL